ncbi:MAG: hypothetical protein KR126chlam6_00179 [Candidatus Anoxychlamydiales bacterium]|nr:hypothetical protein [Candidatus Anoxychlamydiales bacterium]
MKIPSLNITRFREDTVVSVKKDLSIREKIEVIDLTNFERYRKHTYFETLRKAAFVFLFSPAIMCLKISFNILLIGFDCFKGFWNSSATMLDDFVHLRIIKLVENYCISRIELVQYLVEDVIFIVRVPFYTLALQFASIFTIAFPNHGKKLIANIERKSNYNMDITYHFTNNKEFKNKTLIRAIFNTLLHRDQKVVFYLAPCFQPIGKLTDVNVISPKK